MALACSPCPPLASWPPPALGQRPHLRCPRRAGCPPGRLWRSPRRSEPSWVTPPGIRQRSCHVLFPEELHRAWSERPWDCSTPRFVEGTPRDPHMPYRAAGEQSTHSRVQLLPKGTTGTTMEGFHASSVHGRMGQHIPNPAGTLTGIVSLAPLTHLLCWEGWLHLSRGQPGTPGLPSFSCGAEGRTQSRFDLRSSGCIHQRYCQSSYHALLQSTATHVVAKMSPKRCKRPFWSLPLPAPGSKWRG